MSQDAITHSSPQTRQSVVQSDPSQMQRHSMTNQSVADQMSIHRQSCANPFPILFQAGVNLFPIHTSIRFQSINNLLPTGRRSIANPVPIWFQSSANPTSFRGKWAAGPERLSANQYKSMANPPSQSMANRMSILSQYKAAANPNRLGANSLPISFQSAVNAANPVPLPMPSLCRTITNPSPISYDGHSVPIRFQPKVNPWLPIPHESLANPSPICHSMPISNPMPIHHQSANPSPICQSITNLLIHHQPKSTRSTSIHRQINYPTPIPDKSAQQSTNPMQIHRGIANQSIRCQSSGRLPIQDQHTNQMPVHCPFTRDKETGVISSESP